MPVKCNHWCDVAMTESAKIIFVTDFGIQYGNVAITLNAH